MFGEVMGRVGCKMRREVKGVERVLMFVVR